MLNAHLILGKLSGRKLAFGPVTDASLIARRERGSYAATGHFRSQNDGMSLNFAVPG